MPTQDPYKTLHDRYMAELTALDRKKDTIRTKIQTLDELQSEIGSASAPCEPQSPIEATTELLPDKLTDACTWIVEKYGRAGLSTREIKDFLFKHGHKPSGKNFGVTVFNTLGRLVATDRISGDKTGTTWKFRPKLL